MTEVYNIRIGDMVWNKGDGGSTIMGVPGTTESQMGITISQRTTKLVKKICIKQSEQDT